jgi:sulfate adenylyltransferase (ADP) / ATP adenylyltransferase
MVIADVPSSNPAYYLLLNKFPIIPNHFMLVTRENKPQNQKLEQGDIEATYACIQSWRESSSEGVERQLFGFFNSGEHSGASQAHRHVQFIPVESITVESAGTDKPNKTWTLLMTRLSEDRLSVPFTYYWSPLPKDPSAATLYQIYTNLYNAAQAAVIEYIKRHPGELEIQDSEHGSSGFSYNLGITASEMFICPRRKEGAALKNDEGVEVGFAALNGSLLAGSMMVKHQQEWECVKSRPGIVDEILEAIGIPWPTEGNGSSAKI